MLKLVLFRTIFFSCQRSFTRRHKKCKENMRVEADAGTLDNLGANFKWTHITINFDCGLVCFAKNSKMKWPEKVNQSCGKRIDKRMFWWPMMMLVLSPKSVNTCSNSRSTSVIAKDDFFFNFIETGWAMVVGRATSGDLFLDKKKKKGQIALILKFNFVFAWLWAHLNKMKRKKKEKEKSI